MNEYNKEASNLKRSDPPTSNSTKPLASISLDLDNLWSYMKTHGDTGWEEFPTYFDILIPYVLDLLDRLNLKITFFIVGQDAALDKNKDALKALTERGHEVGNHSFHHQQWLHLYSKDQLKAEISEAEDQILRVTGQKPVGFRGPGFGWSPDLFAVLAENDYVFDASTFPTYLGPLAKLYYLGISSLNEEKREQANEIFGSFKDGMRPVKPYYWHLDSGATLLEIPVTTIPIIKTPFHMSYLLYLSRFSVPLMFTYLELALALCRITRTEPSFLIHPTDFLDRDLVPELAFFPGMDLSQNKKIEVFEKVIKKIERYFTFVNMRCHAESIMKRKKMRVCCLLP